MARTERHKIHNREAVAEMPEWLKEKNCPHKKKYMEGKRIHPKNLTGIEGFGLTVVEQVPIEVEPTDENRHYLATKRDKLGHRLHHQDLRFRENKGE